MSLTSQAEFCEYFLFHEKSHPFDLLSVRKTILACCHMKVSFRAI